MWQSRVFLAATLAAVFAGSTLWAQAPTVVALTNVRVIDGTDQEPIVNGVIVMRDGRIESVGSATAVRIPANAQVVDLAGRTVVPGFIDTHVHLSAVRAVRPTDFTPEDLRSFLNAGVTTIRSAGDATPWIFGLGKDVASGRIAGPRIVAAGPMFTAVGGHPAGTWLKGSRARPCRGQATRRRRSGGN
jgi:imidazolonepropionase-like amidohydrolase